MTDNIRDLMEILHNYLDRADVLITNEYYWYVGTIEVIALSMGIKATAYEVREVAMRLMEEY